MNTILQYSTCIYTLLLFAQTLWSLPITFLTQSKALWEEWLEGTYYSMSLWHQTK